MLTKYLRLMHFVHRARVCNCWKCFWRLACEHLTQQTNKELKKLLQVTTRINYPLLYVSFLETGISAFFSPRPRNQRTHNTVEHITGQAARLNLGCLVCVWMEQKIFWWCLISISGPAGFSASEFLIMLFRATSGEAADRMCVSGKFEPITERRMFERSGPTVQWIQWLRT